MHMMGKVGVWLVVVVAAVSTVLTSKLVQVRNSWTKKSVKLQADYQALQQKIGVSSAELARAEAELFRSRELWGQYLNDVNTTVNPATGVVNIERGLNHGLHEKQTLYGFELKPEGAIYRGDFTVVTARDVQAQLQPNWKIRPEDVQTWAPNGTWRWRNLIPPGYQPNFDTQLAAIERANDSLEDRKKKLTIETGLEKAAAETLKRREDDLQGGESLTKDPAVDPEFRIGLIPAVEEVEESRNLSLRKVDELRRRLRAVQRDVDRMKVDNVELTRKLPQPPATVGANQN